MEKVVSITDSAFVALAHERRTLWRSLPSSLANP